MEPLRPEAVPGLEAARLAVAEARQREADLALEIQSVELEGAAAGNVRGRVASRVAGSGGIARQEDVDDIADAEAVIASVEPRVSILQDALRVAEGATKAAEKRHGAIVAAELNRRAPAVKAAADAAFARMDAAKAEHQRFLNLAAELRDYPRYSGGGVARDADQLFAASAEYATGGEAP